MLKLNVSFEIIAHEEQKFRRILDLDGISPNDLMSSLDMDRNKHQIFGAGEGSGASGSFFFFSADNRFLIKTLTRPEKAKALAILDDYLDHLIDTENRSLLARIYGIFTLKTKLFEPVDFMIM